MDKTIEVMYIPRSKIAEYKKAGWTIKNLDCHHGAYSVLAVRDVRQKRR
jgi:hypothetical protein